ncbi:hypothetical protein BC829DRAFT_380469 [Chytridium lagenaria]|nr:hypothetical protein BC829DRAFT_380469 [Chytridium lagenaria]
MAAQKEKKKKASAVAAVPEAIDRGGLKVQDVGTAPESSQIEWGEEIKKLLEIFHEQEQVIRNLEDESKSLVENQRDIELAVDMMDVRLPAISAEVDEFEIEMEDILKKMSVYGIANIH